MLVTPGEEAAVDLRPIHENIGAAGRVSFAKPEALLDLLGVAPGAVTALGRHLRCGQQGKDGGSTARCSSDPVINVHPLTNAATTSIARDDLLAVPALQQGTNLLILKVSDYDRHMRSLLTDLIRLETKIRRRMPLKKWLK